MTTINNLFTAETILEFHIGRGGKSHNAGHLTFKAAGKRIDQTSVFDELFLKEEDEANPDGEYRDECGNTVRLTVSEAKSGIGRIDIDGEYNTTYCIRIADMDKDEQEAVIRDSSEWERVEIFAATEKFPNSSILLAEYFEMYDELVSDDNFKDGFEASNEEPEDGDSVLIDGVYYIKKD